MVPAFFMTTILRHVLPRPHRLQTRIRPSNSVRHGIRTSLRSRIQTPVRPGVLVRGPLPVNRIDTLPLYCISGCGTAHGTKRPEPGKPCRHSHSPDKQHGWSRKPPAWRGEHGHFRRRSFALRATAGPNAAGTYRTGRHICLRIAPQAAPPRSLRTADGYGVAARGARRSGPLEPRTVHLPAG